MASLTHRAPRTMPNAAVRALSCWLRSARGAAKPQPGSPTQDHATEAAYAKGFTLIELMVSIAVVSVAFVGFYLCLGQGIALTEVRQQNLRATQILVQQMETIRLYTWSQINSNGFVPTSFSAPLYANSTNDGSFSGTILITNAPMVESYATNNVLVTVTLNWTSNDGNQHTRAMSTLVSEYGLHNYYY